MQKLSNDVIMEITNINMLNRPSHLRKTEKIKNCLKEVKSKIKEFENSVYGKNTEQ